MLEWVRLMMDGGGPRYVQSGINNHNKTKEKRRQCEPLGERGMGRYA